MSFASVLFRFCRLVFYIMSHDGSLYRLIGSRAITSNFQDLHEEFCLFVGSLNSAQIDKSWRDQFDADKSTLQLRFMEVLSTDKIFAGTTFVTERSMQLGCFINTN